MIGLSTNVTFLSSFSGLLLIKKEKIKISLLHLQVLLKVNEDTRLECRNVGSMTSHEQ